MVRCGAYAGFGFGYCKLERKENISIDSRRGGRYSAAMSTPFLPFNSVFPLKSARAHEVCGAGAFAFAAMICGMGKGSVLWISGGHEPEQLHPDGLARFADPGRFLFARARNHLDTLWMAEEALRSTATPLVVTRISQPLSLTAGRRLQLAAETGQSLGLFLIPEGMGSNAAETRWRCTPLVGTESTLFEGDCIKNKSGTTNKWNLRWDDATHSIHPVSGPRERAIPAALSI